MIQGPYVVAASNEAAKNICRTFGLPMKNAFGSNHKRLAGLGNCVIFFSKSPLWRYSLLKDMELYLDVLKAHGSLVLEIPELRRVNRP